MPDLHVVPDERTSAWRIYASDERAPLSEHTNASDAELAAQRWAERRGAERVIVHDRYHRTHEPSPSLAQLRTRARRARARELAVVRERIKQPADSSRTRPM